MHILNHCYPSLHLYSLFWADIYW